MPQSLRYHDAILRLLAEEPKITASRQELLAARESYCGIKFPESVREWFSISDAEGLFYVNTNEDDLQELVKLGDPKETAQGYLRVATENQAVVAWFVALDGSDDPPVLHNNDDWSDDLSTISWVSCSDTFSAFIFDMIASNYFGGWYSGAYVSGIASYPDTSVIKELRTRYSEGPITDHPDSRVRRFFTPHGIIRIISNTPELIADNLAEWSVEADSLDTLEKSIRSIWHIYNLPQSLAANGNSPELANDVLKRIRKNRA